MPSFLSQTFEIRDRGARSGEAPEDHATLDGIRTVPDQVGLLYDGLARKSVLLA